MSNSPDYIGFCPAPTDEPCLQTGCDSFEDLDAEATRMQVNLERVFPNLPEGMSWMKSHVHHDFGIYFELRLVYNAALENHCRAVRWVEGYYPETWDGIPAPIPPVPIPPEPNQHLVLG